MTTLSLFDLILSASEPQPAPAEPMPVFTSPAPIVAPVTPETPHPTASAPEWFKFTACEPERAFYWIFRGFQRPDRYCWTTMEKYEKYKKHQGGIPGGSHWTYQPPEGALMCCKTERQ